MEKSLDTELWHACAGGMVKIPPVNSEVFYFPQGHAEHVTSQSPAVDFPHFLRIPPLILCHVTAVKYLANSKTDEVYAKLELIPDSSGTGINQEQVFEGNGKQQPPVSFAKMLTQSDANNGGGFSVPRYCADTIFPPLDYTADPPVQNIVAKDVHGETWKFRHIYRGTPRRHLLTTGWSAFVNHKRLTAGDSVVFLRAVSGDIYIGVRRMKHGETNTTSSSDWSGFSDSCFSSLIREEAEKGLKENMCNNGNGCGSGVSSELVVEAAIKAASGKVFEVVYHPRTSIPEFCVMARTVKRAMEVQWCHGMRFKMAFETEDSSRISWFMGTVSAVKPADTIRWPDSPWRLLEVAWDEPEMVHNVKRVNPWLVEPVSTLPPLNLSLFSPPFKRLRRFQPLDFSINHSEFPVSSNLFQSRNLLPENRNKNAPTGIQGARHTQYDPPLTRLINPKFSQSASRPDNNVSCLLTTDYNDSTKNIKTLKTPKFVLFGIPIFTEQETSLPLEETSKHSSCNYDDVGHTLDLSVLGSYNALSEKLGHMFKHHVMLTNVMYCNSAGEFRPVTDHEPFREFARTARRLKIQMDSTTSKY